MAIVGLGGQSGTIMSMIAIISTFLIRGSQTQGLDASQCSTAVATVGSVSESGWSQIQSVSKMVRSNAVEQNTQATFPSFLEIKEEVEQNHTAVLASELSERTCRRAMLQATKLVRHVRLAEKAMMMANNSSSLLEEEMSLPIPEKAMMIANNSASLLEEEMSPPIPEKAMMIANNSSSLLEEEMSPPIPSQIEKDAKASQVMCRSQLAKAGRQLSKLVGDVSSLTFQVRASTTAVNVMRKELQSKFAMMKSVDKTTVKEKRQCRRDVIINKKIVKIFKKDLRQIRHLSVSRVVRKFNRKRGKRVHGKGYSCEGKPQPRCFPIACVKGRWICGGKRGWRRKRLGRKHRPKRRRGKRRRGRRLKKKNRRRGKNRRNKRKRKRRGKNRRNKRKRKRRKTKRRRRKRRRGKTKKRQLRLMLMKALSDPSVSRDAVNAQNLVNTTLSAATALGQCLNPTAVNHSLALSEGRPKRRRRSRRVVRKHHKKVVRVVRKHRKKIVRVVRKHRKKIVRVVRKHRKKKKRIRHRKKKRKHRKKKCKCRKRRRGKKGKRRRKCCRGGGAVRRRRRASRKPVNRRRKIGRPLKVRHRRRMNGRKPLKLRHRRRRRNGRKPIRIRHRRRMNGTKPPKMRHRRRGQNGRKPLKLHRRRRNGKVRRRKVGLARRPLKLRRPVTRPVKLHRRRRQTSGGRRRYRRVPISCRSKVKHLAKTYISAQTEMTKLITSYKYTSKSRACFTAATVHRRNYMTVQERADELSTEISRRLDHLEQLRPALAEAKRARRQLRNQIRALKSECKGLPVAEKTLHKTSIAIKHLLRCPGLRRNRRIRIQRRL